MKLKKFYKTPSSKIIVIEDSDIIATSNGGSDDSGGTQPKGSIYLPFVGQSQDEGFAD